jgi:hypothetical protein
MTFPFLFSWCIEILIRLNDIVKEISNQTCAESVCPFQDVSPEIFSSLATLICRQITLFMDNLKPSQNSDEEKQQQEIKDNLIILWLSLQLLKNKMTQVKTQEQVQSEVLESLKYSLLQIIKGKVFTNSHTLQESHIHAQLLNAIQFECCKYSIYPSLRGHCIHCFLLLYSGKIHNNKNYNSNNVFFFVSHLFLSFFLEYVKVKS